MLKFGVGIVLLAPLALWLLSVSRMSVGRSGTLVAAIIIVAFTMWIYDTSCELCEGTGKVLVPKDEVDACRRPPRATKSWLLRGRLRFARALNEQTRHDIRRRLPPGPLVDGLSESGWSFKGEVDSPAIHSLEAVVHEFAARIESTRGMVEVTIPVPDAHPISQFGEHYRFYAVRNGLLIRVAAQASYEDPIRPDDIGSRLLAAGPSFLHGLRLLAEPGEIKADATALQAWLTKAAGTSAEDSDGRPLAGREQAFVRALDDLPSILNAAAIKIVVRFGETLKPDSRFLVVTQKHGRVDAWPVSLQRTAPASVG